MAIKSIIQDFEASGRAMSTADFRNLMRREKQRKSLKALIPQPLLPSLGEGEPEPKAESLVLKKSSIWGDPKTGFFAAPSPKLGRGLG
jgi:hypothetical protein